MLAEERRAILIQELNNNGYIQVADLAEQFSTSAATIRRDLYQLENEGLCIRKRGGAVRSSQGVTLELPYSIKQNRAMEEKKRIAEAAEQLVEEGDTILLDAGSTTFALAALLVVKQRITVVTNDLHIAVKLAGNPNITLITTGGVARPYVFSLQGWQTESFIRNLKVDKTFLGADAVHADGMVANVNIDEVAIKQAMIEAADQVILLADSSKFDKTGFFKVCSLARISKVITDRGITQENLELIRSFNTQTVTV